MDRRELLGVVTGGLLAAAPLAAEAQEAAKVALRKLEARRYDPAGTLRRIAKALGVPVTELLG